MKTAIAKIEFPDNYDAENIAGRIEDDIHQISKCTILNQADVDEQVYQATKRTVDRLCADLTSRKVIVYRNHDRQEEGFRGTFHDWGLDALDWAEGACSLTKGIVEDESGMVHMVWPALIKFVVEGK